MCSLFHIFYQWQSLNDYEKCFLFHLKSSFCSRDIQSFVFLFSALFPFFRHCFKVWSETNLEIYDIINSLNKNLARHFVWCLEKEKRYEFGTLSIDRVLNKEHFLEKVCTKLVSDAFLVLVSNPKQPLHPLWKVRYF